MKIKNLKGASVDSLLLTFIQIVTYATGMITTKLISVALSLDEYGTYSSVMLVISVAVSFTLLGLGDCLNYFYNNKTVCKDDSDRENYVNSIFMTQSIIGIAVSLIIFFSRGLIAEYFGSVAVQALLLFVCVKPWFENAIHLYSVLFVSVGKAKVVAIRNFFLALARVIIVYVSLHLYHRLDLVFILLVSVDIIQILTLNRVFAKKHFVVNPFKGQIDKIKPILSYGIPMGMYFVTNTLMREIDKLVVGRLALQSDLAVYTNCSKLLPLNLVISSFATVLVPYITNYVSTKNYSQASKLFSNYMKLGYLSIWMLSGAILVSAREVIPFLYSDEYLKGIAVFVLYVLDGMLQFASMHLIIAAHGESKYLMRLSFGLLVANAVLNVGLFYVFKLIGNALIGPAVATLIVNTGYTFLVLRKSKNILQEKISDLLEIKRMILYLFELVIVGILVWFLKNKCIEIGMNRFVAMIAACVIYCAIIFAIHFKEYIVILKDINSYKMK